MHRPATQTQDQEQQKTQACADIESKQRKKLKSKQNVIRIWRNNSLARKKRKQHPIVKKQES